MNSLLPILRNSGWIGRPRLDIFERFFDDFQLPGVLNENGEWMPKIDVKETEAEFVINAEVPGMSKEDISITMTDGLLTLSGEKKHEHEEKKGDYHVMERRFGSFKRSFRLPEHVEAEKIDASYKDGVLTISIPKPETVQPKKIEIKH